MRGVEGLSIVDASVFPLIPNSNIHAPVVMVAEKAADILLQRQARPAPEQEGFRESSTVTGGRAMTDREDVP